MEGLKNQRDLNYSEEERCPMENSYRFFANKACRFYPCHKGIEELNCLFCFCPLYFLEHCPGSPEWIEVPGGKGEKIKDCSGCTFPHEPENYDVIMRILREATGFGR